MSPPCCSRRRTANALIALWALDCAYCEPNLEALATLQRAHPHDIELVTVATDTSTSAKRSRPACAR